MQEPEAAAAELERCIKELGFRGLEILTNVQGENLHSARFAPLYRKMQELDVAAFVHPQNVLGQDRLGQFFMNNIIGNPSDTAVAAGCLIFGGVLEEMPDLRFVLAHGGGTCPLLRGRWEHAWRQHLILETQIPRPPSEYFSKLYFDTLTHSTPRAELPRRDGWGGAPDARQRLPVRHGRLHAARERTGRPAPHRRPARGDLLRERHPRLRPRLVGAMPERVALVTGATSGIGLAIARALGRDGARVIVHGRRDDGRRIADEVGGVFIAADLSRPEDVDRLAQESLAVAGRVDVLVNNAGYQHIDAVEDFPDDVWAAMQQAMLTAPFQLTKALLPGMKAAGWGRIVNISSTQGLAASPYKSAYAAAKHGLIGLTKAVALEAGPFGVTVNAICPAYVRTPLVEAQIADQSRTLGLPESEVVQRVMLEPAAVKRLIEPEEVAELALYLASDGAGAVTGGAFTIDGGWTAR